MPEKRGRRRGAARDLAIAEGRKTFFTGVACKHGHISERSVKTQNCCECQRLYRLSYKPINPKLRDPEKMWEAQRRWRGRNAEKHRAAQKRWRDKNPDKVREGSREWRLKAAAALRALKELGIEI